MGKLFAGSRRDGGGKVCTLKGGRLTQQGGEARLVHSIGDAIQNIELFGGHVFDLRNKYKSSANLRR